MAFQALFDYAGEFSKHQNPIVYSCSASEISFFFFSRRDTVQAGSICTDDCKDLALWTATVF